MPRQGRINIEGGLYHVIQRGVERRKLFKDCKDRREFYFGHQELGLSGAILADYFNIIRTSISAAISRGRKIAEKMNILISNYVPKYALF